MVDQPLDVHVVAMLHQRVKELEADNAEHSRRWAALASECHDLRIELAQVRKLVFDSNDYFSRVTS